MQSKDTVSAYEECGIPYIQEERNDLVGLQVPSCFIEPENSNWVSEWKTKIERDGSVS